MAEGLCELEPYSPLSTVEYCYKDVGADASESFKLPSSRDCTASQYKNYNAQRVRTYETMQN